MKEEGEEEIRERQRVRGGKDKGEDSDAERMMEERERARRRKLIFRPNWYKQPEDLPHRDDE